MILVDTGYFIALASPRDAYHSRALVASSRYREPLVTTWPVLTETCHILLHRLGSGAETAFLKGIVAAQIQVTEMSAADVPRLTTLMTRYASLPMDLADASLVLLAERLGSGRIFSTDQRDFGTYRWKAREPFENLML